MKKSRQLITKSKSIKTSCCNNLDKFRKLKPWKEKTKEKELNV